MVLNGDSAEFSPLSLNKSSTDTGLGGTFTGESNCIRYECGVSGPALSLPESLSSDDELIANPLVGGNDVVGERCDFPCLLNDRSPGRMWVGGVMLPKLFDFVRDIAVIKNKHKSQTDDHQKFKKTTYVAVVYPSCSFSLKLIFSYLHLNAHEDSPQYLKMQAFAHNNLQKNIPIY